MRWAYGVTTVPERRFKLLPQTLSSLREAGFDTPRLFVDDCHDIEPYKSFTLPVTLRGDRIGTTGHWLLALSELFIRWPKSDRYALFQDDILCCSNLREYLEQSIPDDSYLNLCTYPRNLTKDTRQIAGWFKAPALGKGAQGLVFTNETVKTLLTDPTLLKHLQSPKGFKNLDGTIYNALTAVGYTELVHGPSLLDHIGLEVSSMNSKPQPVISSFLGEAYNPLTLLGATNGTQS